MRTFIVVCVLVFVCGEVGRAQSPPLPPPDTAPGAAPAETPLPAPTVPQLIPDETLPAVAPTATAPSLQQLDEAFKDKPISTGAADFRNRLEWRRLRNIVTNDAELKSALATAEAAKTDLQKRKLLRRYYEMYYGRMIKLATTPEMKAYLTARQNEELGILPQPHVRPTPTPSPSAKPAATQPPPPPLPSPSASPPAGLPTPLPGAR